jgi:hypothetical protein
MPDPDLHPLMPLARATSLFGFRDPQNFRVSVAPRLGIHVFLVGRRWFARDADVRAAFAFLTSPQGKGREEAAVAATESHACDRNPIGVPLGILSPSPDSGDAPSQLTPASWSPGHPAGGQPGYLVTGPSPA